jgi:hypothetical protein
MDVLVVGLGSTAGLRRAEDALVESMRRAGAEVGLARAEPQADVRTLAYTDWRWALAARRAARAALAASSPRAVLYYTTTAALFWPRAGAVRFDSLAADSRPGRHGFWQRGVERRRLAAATAVVPSAADVRFPMGVVVPPAVDASAPLGGERDVAAVCYGANPAKKGLDRILSAWARARHEGEELIVGGISSDSDGISGPRLPDGVRFAGALAPEEWRALVRRARIFVSASRFEDFGIAQLEALADGCVLVTVASPGPYVALPLARSLDPRLVVREDGDLAAAIRVALDDPKPDYAERAAPLLAPYSSAAVDALVADRLLPELLR